MAGKHSGEIAKLRTALRTSDMQGAVAMTAIAAKTNQGETSDGDYGWGFKGVKAAQRHVIWRG